MGKRDAALMRAERLAAGLRSHRSPTVCPNCLAYFVYGCSSEDRATCLHANIVFLIYNCHDFWNTLVRFLLHDWNPRRQLGVHERLKSNRDRCTVCPADRLWGRSGSDYLRHVLDSCCRALYLCLSKPLSRNDKHYWDTLTRWPHTLNQLMPYGPRASANSMIQLLGTVDYAEHIFAAVLENDRPHLMPIVSEDMNRNGILSRVLEVMKSINASWRKQAAERSSADRGRLRSSPTGAMPFLLITLCLPHDDAGMDAAYLRGYHKQLSDELNTLIRLGEQCGVDTREYMRPASALWNKLPAHLRGEKAPFVLSEDGKAAIVFSDPYQHLHGALLEVALKQCRGSDCPPEQLPGTLRLCSSCGITHYCSRVCQKADWKRQHKQLCAMLQQLFEFATPDMSEEDFSAACRENEFPLARVDRLIKWASGDPTCYALGAPDEADEVIL